MSEHTRGETRAEGRRLLIPLADTVTARDAVDYAVSEASHGSVHIVIAQGESSTREDDQEVEYLLSRARAWAEEDIEEAPVTIETGIIGGDRFLFAPGDYATLFADYMDEHALDALVLDPEYWSNTNAALVDSFRTELEGREIPVERPPIPRPQVHERIAGRWSLTKAVTVFAVSLGFYLILGDPFYWFDIVTGVAVAAITAITLSHVTFGREPIYPTSIYRTIRFGLYIPYLIWEIIKANVAIAIVILRPSMPIDPRMTRVRARVDSGLPTLALANSITLTPGTLTVRAEDQQLIVHTLLPVAREDLFGGRLERAVRFVFYGREAARIPTPRERDEADVIEAGEDW